MFGVNFCNAYGLFTYSLCAVLIDRNGSWAIW
jgi:hypothetical protein